MTLLDIAGPVMVGPSSSHTAGACRIGAVSRRLLGEPIKSAHIYLHGSFSATGKGHGTHQAIVAGLLGFREDDLRLPESFVYAEERGLLFEIEDADLGDVHPNTARICMEGNSGKRLTVEASSVGGGRVSVSKMDGCPVEFSGGCPTLIVRNQDIPGAAERVAGTLERFGINIACMTLRRERRGGQAVMVLECDEEIPQSVRRELERMRGVLGVAYISPREG